MASGKTEKSNKTSRTDSQRGQIELFPVDGNTVRKTAPQPSDPARSHNEELKARRMVWEEEERAKRTQRRMQRNRVRAMRMNRIYAIFLSLCVCVIFGICFQYIQLQSEASTLKSSITALQSDVNDLEADNEEMLQNIETSIDMGQILEYAMNDLGMTYPSEDQIVTYEADASDTLTQYAEISSAGSSILSEILGN